MATYQPPKRGVEYIFYVGLVSQADAKLLKGSATLAAGDVQVSKDGGAFANLTTLPAVTPAGGKAIKVTLSATEMTADNVTVVFSDAAGSEWCDLIVNIATAARQIDDLATPTNITAGTITTATNLTNLPAIPANWLTAAGIATDAVNEIADGVRARQLTESYAADGVAPTLEQAVLLIQQMLTEMSIAGTTMTIKKLDGTTTAATLTLNDATTPTSVTRAT